MTEGMGSKAKEKTGQAKKTSEPGTRCGGPSRGARGELDSQQLATTRCRFRARERGGAASKKTGGATADLSA